MKKFFVFALAVLLVFAFTLPAAAVEHQFGGYWRTRFAAQQNFSGEDSTERLDVTLVDTRTRLYYTAVLHDNLKLVNKFEMDATWGDTVRGDIGADGITVEVKNSYADFNLSDWNFKVGTQGFNLARGFLFADDASGIVATYHGDNFDLPIFWFKTFEGSTAGYINDNEQDVDFYGTSPVFKINDVSVNPFFVWATSENLSSWAPITNANDANRGATGTLGNVDIYYAGFNLDYKADDFSLWGTFIYEAGEAEIPATPVNLDINGYLIAFGGNVDLNDIELHGQVIYATGDSTLDQEVDSFFVPSPSAGQGQSYYWAEIMGLGVFDNRPSNNAPGDKISNLIAFNIGTKFSPMDKLTVGIDLWNASLEEDDGFGEDHLGTEIDVRLTYKLLEGLNADLVGAYLFAGDATYKELPGQSSSDPWELAFQLSLSF